MDYQKITLLIQELVTQKVVPGISLGTIDARGAATNFYGALGNDAPFAAQMLSQQHVYDIASLTKVVGTTTRILQLIDQHKLQLATPIASILPEYANLECTIEDLLLHRSGLPADLLDKQHVTKEKVQTYIISCPISATKQTVYSDLGFFLLGEVICHLDQCSLAESFKHSIFAPMKLTNTDYHVINKQIAVPTEITDTRGIIQGIVQDSKAYQIKTPIGSAGLFAPLMDLMKFVQCILKNRDQTQAPVFSQALFQQLLSTNINGRTFGWEIKYNQNQEKYLYHTGFSGTSIGMNFKTKEALILLTNRTFPNRKERGFIAAREKIYTYI